MIDPQLTGKTVLVTGANHGIGAAIALAFAAQGARLFLTFYRERSPYTPSQLEAARRAGEGGDLLYRAMQQQDADWVVARIQEMGGRAVAYEADLGVAMNIPALFDRCEAEIGPVDVLVANHTYCVLESFDPATANFMDAAVRFISAAQIDAHFAVNARGVALLMAGYVQRYVGREATWGRIVNISTDAAHAHSANVSYAASKHAIESYSRSAAAELGRYGITVNVVAPGPIQTGYIPPQDEAKIAADTPLGRIGRPEDIADVVVFLASEQAHWLTGQLLYAGGGWRMPQ
jgi:3-oxoacyl-[acyl-carrier protein] reductase